MTNLALTTLTYPNSKHSLEWVQQFEAALLDVGISCRRNDEREFRVPLDYKPGVLELVVQEIYEYLLTTRYLRTPPRSGLPLSLHLKMIAHHMTEIGGVLLSHKFRRMKQGHGRRNLDISLAYLAQKDFLEEGTEPWLLNLEDDAKLRVSPEQASRIIRAFTQASPEGIWIVDLSKSYSLQELGIKSAESALRPVEGVGFSEVSGRASNTFCSVLIDRKTWLSYLKHLEGALNRKGLRLIPCDWIFNDFAQTFERISNTRVQPLRTYLTNEGVFVQTSLHDNL